MNNISHPDPYNTGSPPAASSSPLVCSPASRPAFCWYSIPILFLFLTSFINILRPDVREGFPDWLCCQLVQFFFSCSCTALDRIIKGQRSLWAMVWATLTWVLLWRSQIAFHLIVTNRSDFRKSINQGWMEKSLHLQSFTVMYVIIKSFRAAVLKPCPPGPQSSRVFLSSPRTRNPGLSTWSVRTPGWILDWRPDFCRLLQTDKFIVDSVYIKYSW